MRSKESIIRMVADWYRPVFDTTSLDVAMRCLQALGDKIFLEKNGNNLSVKLKFWGRGTPFLYIENFLTCVLSYGLEENKEKDKELMDFLYLFQDNFREAHITCRTINDLISAQNKEKEDKIRFLIDLEKEVEVTHRKWR